MKFPKKLLTSILLVIFATLTFLPAPITTTANTSDFFTDTNGHWSDPYAELLHEKCDLQGFRNAEGKPLHQFKPNNYLTRADLVTMMYMCSGISAAEVSINQPFSDVAVNHYFFTAVAIAKAQGWIQGFKDGTFGPYLNVTRDQTLKIVLLSKYTEEQIDKLTQGKSEPFYDVSTKDWSWKYVVYAATNNYVKGYKDGGFHPNAPITRGEAAKIIATIYGYIEVETVPEPEPTPEPVAGTSPRIGNCEVFPSDNPWNIDISDYPVHPNSDAYIATMLSNGKDNLHPDFGGNGEYGIPFVTVRGDQPRVPLEIEYESESDPGPYPIPNDVPIEGGSDRHILVIDTDNCKLYETWDSEYNGSGWSVGAAAIFDLTSNELRPDGWTSADAAGLPVFAGLIRYDEVKAGAINHAIRFTAKRTQRGYIYPATHFASTITDEDVPPMGLRLRLKADFDLSGYTGDARVVLEALKKYGMILADNGSDWYVTGEMHSGWDDEDIHQLKSVPGSAFEAVYTGEIRN